MLTTDSNYFNAEPFTTSFLWDPNFDELDDES